MLAIHPPRIDIFLNCVEEPQDLTFPLPKKGFCLTFSFSRKNSFQNTAFYVREILQGIEMSNRSIEISQTGRSLLIAGTKLVVAWSD